MIEPTTAETISSIAADPQRFNTEREALRRYCFAILRNEADAEDAVQFSLERALRYGKARSDHRRWLLAIARNVCRDMLKARVATDEPPDDFPASPSLDPEHVVTRRSALAGALGTLTPMERRAVGASWLADATSYDAARSVGMAHQTVRVHLTRARKKLADYLDDLERVTAGFLPWLLDQHQRLTRRLANDPSFGDRLLAFAAPPVVLALTVATLTALSASSARVATPRESAAGPTSAVASAALPAAALEPTVHASGHATSVPAGLAQKLLPAISPGRAQDAFVSDVQPSPNYAQDHTVYAAGTDSACGGRAACGELFVSRDAGHSWANLESIGLQSQAELLLPPSAYSTGVFYAFGAGGLQITHDSGQTFTTMIQDLPGYAGLLPAGESSYVSVSNVDLWSFASAPAPGVQSAFPPGAIAVGAAIPLGGSLLQPVQLPSGPEEILACSSTCAARSALPWSDDATKLIANAGGSLLIALGPHGLAESRDAGASFTLVHLGSPVEDATVVGTRIVAVAGGSVIHSDDAGLTWSTAQVGGGLPSIVRVAGGQSLILELIQASGADRERLAGYACSGDGGTTWSAC